jgi:methylisocitrate lyase
MNAESTVLSPGNRLRALLERPGMLRVPGVHDGFSARAAEVLGFEALYVGGGLSVGIGNALPDMGLMQSSHMIEYAGRLARLVDVPLIADLDDGGGSPLRAQRAVWEAEQAGIAAVHVEDTDFTRGRHFPGKPGGWYMDSSEDGVIEFEDAIARLRGAVAGRREMVIVGRTEAAVASLEEAIRRARAFADEGADMIFVAHLTPENTKMAASAIPVPVMNCLVPQHRITAAECAQMEADGLKLLFDHRVAPLAAYAAEWAALEQFRDSGEIFADPRETRQKMAQVIRYDEWGEIARGYQRTRRPTP